MTALHDEDWFTALTLPEHCFLRQKWHYEYTTPNHFYDVDLFRNTDGTYYAIGVPRDADKVIVYGTSMVASPQIALQSLFAKIQHGGFEGNGDGGDAP